MGARPICSCGHRLSCWDLIVRIVVPCEAPVHKLRILDHVRDHTRSLVHSLIFRAYVGRMKPKCMHSMTHDTTFALWPPASHRPDRVG